MTVRLSTAITIVAATIGLLFVRHEQERQRSDTHWDGAVRTAQSCLARGESLVTTHDPICIEAVAEIVRLMPEP
jgi:hypothetical protein